MATRIILLFGGAKLNSFFSSWREEKKQTKQPFVHVKVINNLDTFLKKRKKKKTQKDGTNTICTDVPQPRTIFFLLISNSYS